MGSQHSTINRTSVCIKLSAGFLWKQPISKIGVSCYNGACLWKGMRTMLYTTEEAAVICGFLNAHLAQAGVEVSVRKRNAAFQRGVIMGTLQPDDYRWAENVLCFLKPGFPLFLSRCFDVRSPVLRSPSYLLFFLFRLPPQLSYKAWFVYDICNILFRQKSTDSFSQIVNKYWFYIQKRIRNCFWFSKSGWNFYL